MESKKFIMIGMVVFSAIGGFVPSLWGESNFSMTSILFTALGGGFGIWLGYKLSHYF